MSIYESRPTLIDSAVELQAGVEQTEEGVAVFLRVKFDLEDTVARFDAAHWAQFAADVNDQIDLRRGNAEREAWLARLQPEEADRLRRCHDCCADCQTKLPASWWRASNRAE